MKLVNNVPLTACFSELEQTFQKAIDARVPLNVYEHAKSFRKHKPTKVALKLVETSEN